MDPITALGLALAVIKLLMAVMDFLHAHPQITQEARNLIESATKSLSNSVTSLTAVEPFHFEGP